jgi:hypothetical protein
VSGEHMDVTFLGTWLGDCRWASVCHDLHALQVLQ